MQRVIVGIVFAIILGFIFGSLFMEQGFSVSHWLPGGMLTATACCIIAFVTNVLLKSQRMMRRQEGVKRFASGTSFYYTGRGTDELVDRMRLLIGYGSSAWIENSLSETTSDVSTMVGDLSILVSISGGRSKRFVSCAGGACGPSLMTMPPRIQSDRLEADPVVHQSSVPVLAANRSDSIPAFCNIVTKRLLSGVPSFFAAAT